MNFILSKFGCNNDLQLCKLCEGTNVTGDNMNRKLCECSEIKNMCGSFILTVECWNCVSRKCIARSKNGREQICIKCNTHLVKDGIVDTSKNQRHIPRIFP